MHSKSFVVLAAALLLVASVAPVVATDGSLSVAFEQADDGSPTATVTHNGSAVENASVVVDVNATDGNATYAGAGNHTTDANGSVDLPAPEENVTVDVTAEYENVTASTSADLLVVDANETTETDGNESFGARVSAYVRNLLGGGSGIGQELAAWVVANNPGNAPDHAGPSDANGPPESVHGDETYGDETDGNETASGAPENPGKSGERGNGNGPPEDRGSKGNGTAKGHGK